MTPIKITCITLNEEGKKYKKEGNPHYNSLLNKVESYNSPLIIVATQRSIISGEQHLQHILVSDLKEEGYHQLIKIDSRPALFDKKFTKEEKFKTSMCIEGESLKLRLYIKNTEKNNIQVFEDDYSKETNIIACKSYNTGTLFLRFIYDNQEFVILNCLCTDTDNISFLKKIINKFNLFDYYRNGSKIILLSNFNSELLNTTFEGLLNISGRPYIRNMNKIIIDTLTTIINNTQTNKTNETNIYNSNFVKEISGQLIGSLMKDEGNLLGIVPADEDNIQILFIIIFLFKHGINQTILDKIKNNFKGNKNLTNNIINEIIEKVKNFILNKQLFINVLIFLIDNSKIDILQTIETFKIYKKNMNVSVLINSLKELKNSNNPNPNEQKLLFNTQKELIQNIKEKKNMIFKYNNKIILSFESLIDYYNQYIELFNIQKNNQNNQNNQIITIKIENKLNLLACEFNETNILKFGYNNLLVRE